ncbi:hypothetical protein [Nocardioides hwasunensis]|uniref:Big-1 domain-containing protein n=1 Tax=Nocardioides hwasunensis TaxID=397258 RepID=A0ABR8MBR1_9ACTN|nr:hypothetical protein [Nocardioides hwasunensis]MBD3913580.1 hypothetical protein [Nocardioides hwasunensis]
MQLSKLGQGLAVSAVSALVITGLAVSAAPATAADTAGVRLISQADGLASMRRDASNSVGLTVALTAQRLDPNATISFEVNANPVATDDDPGWTAVATSGETVHQPYTSVQWTPSTDLVGTRIALRAVATVPAGSGSVETRTYSTRRDVALTGAQSTTHAVSVGTSPFDDFFIPIGPSFPVPSAGQIGHYFAQPYRDSGRTASLLRVYGTTSATSGTVELSAWNAADGAFRGQTNAAVSAATLKTNGYSSTAVSGGSFRGLLDISGFDARSGDALAVRAARDTDAVLPVQLTAQRLTAISVGEPYLGEEGASVTLTVLDQDSDSVPGAEVRRMSDGSLVDYTDINGQVSVSQPSSTSERYYANTTDNDAYEKRVDVATAPVRTPAPDAVATGTEAVFAHGPVFDDQEYRAGDIALQVLDQGGAPIRGQQQVTYSVRAAGAEPTAPTTVSTDLNGRVEIPFDPEAPDGEYVLSFTAPESAGGAEMTPVRFVAGDAELDLTPRAGTAPSGGRITYDGRLTVEGKPLPDHAIDLDYTRGTEEAPGTEADAALLVDGLRVLDAQTYSEDDGSFSVTVDDLAEAGGPAETGGRLTVATRDLGDLIEATADFTAAPDTTPTPTPTPTATPAPVPTPTPTPTPVTDPAKATVTLRLTGTDAGPARDRLRIAGSTEVAGQKVRIHVKGARGHWRSVKTLRLDERGNADVTLRDRNGDAVTHYRVRLLPNPDSFAFTSKVLRLR